MIPRSCPFWLKLRFTARGRKPFLATSFRCLVRRSAAGRAGRAGTIPWGVSMCPLMRWARCSLRVPHFRSRTMVASRWKPCHVIHVIHMAPPFPSPPSCCMKRGRCNSSCGSWSSSRSSFNRSSWTCCRSLTSYKLRMRSMEDLRVVAAMDSINFRSRHSMGCNMDQDAPCIAQTNGPWRPWRLATRRAASSHFRPHLGLGTWRTCPRRSQNSFQSAKSQNSEHLWARPRGPSWVNHGEPPSSIHLGAHRDFCFPVVSLMHSPSRCVQWLHAPTAHWPMLLRASGISNRVSNAPATRRNEKRTWGCTCRVKLQLCHDVLCNDSWSY